jgi:hypothetical protein
MMKSFFAWIYKVLIDRWLQPSSKFVAREAIAYVLRPNAEGLNIVVASTKTEFELRGKPTFHHGYMVCDSTNLVETSVLETPALTMIFVARVKQVAGSWQTFIGGSYDNKRGISLYHNPRGMIYQEIAAVAGTQTNRIEVISPLEVDGQDNSLTQWAFIAVTVDPQTQKTSYFTSVTPYTQIDATLLARDLGDREVDLNRQLVVGSVVSANTEAYTAEAHIAEAIYFDRALTQDELALQYAYSKAYHALNGITI